MEIRSNATSVKAFLRPAAAAAAALLLTVGVTGCAQNGWVKPGASPSQASVDATACRRFAHQQHPVFIEAERDALNGPVATSCAMVGIDNARAPCAFNQATRLTARQMDRNERPRQQAFDRCLQERGYVYTRLD